MTRELDDKVLLSGDVAGASGAALCGAAGEAFTLTMLDSYGDGELL